MAHVGAHLREPPSKRDLEYGKRDPEYGKRDPEYGKRDPKQWTLDRIDNTMGHNTNNVLISCLACNLKRRNRTVEKFLFTKQLTIIKAEGALPL